MELRFTQIQEREAAGASGCQQQGTLQLHLVMDGIGEDRLVICGEPTENNALGLVKRSQKERENDGVLR